MSVSEDKHTLATMTSTVIFHNPGEFGILFRYVLTWKNLAGIQDTVGIQHILDVFHYVECDSMLQRHEARLAQPHAMLASSGAAQLQRLMHNIGVDRLSRGILSVVGAGEDHVDVAIAGVPEHKRQRVAARQLALDERDQRRVTAD